MELHDLTGQRFGRLTVIKKTDKRDKHGKVFWLCRCDCGKDTVVSGSHLRGGHTKSCGCLHTTHGRHGTRLYHIWLGMRSRCCNQEDKYFPSYGGRGIRVLEEWRQDFTAFAGWAMANGYRDDLSLDRIDNNSGYFPWNCRWATAKEQQNNRRFSAKNRDFSLRIYLDSAWKVTGVTYCREEALASLFGLSVERIRELTREGVLETTETPDGRRYDLVSSVRKLIKAQ